MFTYRIDEQTELRLLELRHAEELFALTDANRQHLRRWLPWLDTTLSVVDTRSFIQSMISRFAEGRGLTAGIWHRGKLVGTCGFNNINWVNRSADIGYWLAANAQGHGLMTAACRALCDYAFGELRLHRVIIRCATGNVRSCNVPKRLGFTHEGVLRQVEWLYDHYVDHQVYSILAAEWPPQQPHP